MFWAIPQNLEKFPGTLLENIWRISLYVHEKLYAMSSLVK